MSSEIITLLKDILLKGFLETLYMVFWSTLFAVALGFLLALVLTVTKIDGLKPNRVIYKTLDVVINILRSFPFIILIIAIIPLTKVLTGSIIGEKAAIVPLTIGAAPFVARVVESALNEVDKSLIEAAKSFGASNFQILFKVIVKEAMPSIISAITLTTITIIGYSAMAGAVGAGGLGSVAIMYGYNMFNEKVMIYTIIVLILLVQCIQSFGNIVYKKLK
ncbi:binding--dependent transport system inner membrane component family protein [Clostridium argentinense CDC 2741]|uniref:Binding--dependent transport system inner membrane component family protein n=1 Tax=Clostridium argentinense CDC 2741 TaxID=1418104 RepID=A0A0C1UDZ8_9CLOT|nr:methionine ABC transporter permease [Clostridium argentinense]ARC86867.1 methionine ABC transporter permease [Clostridium argentinense]KIE45655.1 binding--dependent transport system inner membrane component family protein [Clostridium argentinense CDC 2741]NFF40955.1 ABC transporter permease [Clostridium argentinense]NFP51546.1 ABC transporter permease [Clostridium argentinense]NFP73549.1 ABC transporter permease [Clostridium argentinense]